MYALYAARDGSKSLLINVSCFVYLWLLLECLFMLQVLISDLLPFSSDVI